MFREKQRVIDFTPQQLIDFETDVSSIFEKGKIRGPVHLSHNNEEFLIDLFQYIHPNDWVFSTWRNHYHALLHGVPQEELMEQILEAHSISFQSPEHNFYTSAIVGGTMPIAVGTAYGMKVQNKTEMVWCFVGDMAAESGIFYESVKYSIRNELPIHFVVEDNGLSTNTPTQKSWGTKTNFGMCDILKTSQKLGEEYQNKLNQYVTYYSYKRIKYPHQGTGKWIHF